MSLVDVGFYCAGAFLAGALLGHRFLPPRIDMERERMLSDLMAREAIRKLRGDS